MRDRVLLFRPLTRQLLHTEVPWKTGSDARTLNAPGDISFTLPVAWADKRATDGTKMLMERGALVVVERPNRTIRNVGLVDDLSLSGTDLTVSCGGLSMLPGQSGPWEGYQGYYVTLDPIEVLHRIWSQVQAYDNANVGVRVTGDRLSGSTVGYPGSARWQAAEQQVKNAAPELAKWEGRQLNRERAASQLLEQVFRHAGLKRVGNVTESENAPEDPGYRADSSLWIRTTDDRVFRWVNDRWLGVDGSAPKVREWREMKRLTDFAKAEIEKFQYLIEPAQARLDEYTELGEAREEFGLYFWQNHDLNSVIEDLVELGPFEFREEAAWDGDDLDLMLRVGAPTVGVRRDELHLELGVNVQEQPVIEAPGDSYTGVALFGAGEGSEVLSAQRDWNPQHMVRRILTETDKDAHTKQLTRAAADRLAKETRAEMQAGFTDLVIHHGKPCPEGSFNVGDILPIAGVLPDGSEETQYVRVLDASNEWGSNKTNVEVEMVS